MQINISEPMRALLEKCVQYAIDHNAWLSQIDYEQDIEITMEEALEFLKDCKE